MRERLAILGGPRAVPEGTVKKWPPIDDIDRKLVLASLEGGNHAFGPNCAAFQQEFAAWNGNRHAVTTSSGTAALHMCVVACDCGAGDEVIVPAYSWSSTATCVLHHNCIPVFVDVDFDTMNIAPDKLESAITAKTKAIMVVHLHGLPADMDKVLAVAKRHKLKVIEDACQAHGARYKGKKVGTIGHCAAFSFNHNKCLCSGEGGMFVTDDSEMLAKAQQLWSFGETRSPLENRDYHAYALGWMYRNNDLTAAFGRAQLSKLDGYLAQIKANARRLTECLRGTPHLILPEEPAGFDHNWYNYTLRFDMAALGEAANGDVGPLEPRRAGDAVAFRQAQDRPGASRGPSRACRGAAFRDRLVKALRAEGVDTGVWQAFVLPAMTVFQARNGYGHGCPWDCRHARPVDYSLGQFPQAVKHCDTHTGMTMPLRPPNGPGVAELMAKGIRKVMAHAADL